jgi:L-amino acid N-acyltransferase YncA
MIRSSLFESNISFSLAVREDLPKIVNTYNLTIPGRKVTADLNPVSVESKISWFDSHQIDNRPLLVIYYEKKYCGWMSFSSFYGRPAYDVTAELSIYLDPEYQGKGIGNFCMIKAEEIALNCGVKNLLGFIFGHNEASLNLFYRHGYEKWGHLPGVALMDRHHRDLLILGKKLHD